MNVRILNAATATNSAPSGATAGFDIRTLVSARPPVNVSGNDDCVLALRGVSTGGTPSVTCKLWVYHVTVGFWLPLGTHATASSKGIINNGNAMTVTETNIIAHAERVFGLRHVDRVYLEITAIAGTGNSVDAYLLGR